MLWWCASHPWHGNRGHTSPYEKRLFSSQHHPDWCDVTRTNIMRLFHCLRSSIVSVCYGYHVWQGSGCVSGTCVPSKSNQAWFDLLDDFQSSCCSGGLWEGRWWKGGQLESSLLQLCFFFYISCKETDPPEIAVTVQEPLLISVYPFAYSQILSITTPYNRFIIGSTYFQLLETIATGVIKRRCFFLVILSHLIHLPSLNEIPFLWYCLLMRFVWSWHLFIFLPLALWRQHFLQLQAVYLAVFDPKPIHFTHPKHYGETSSDGLPRILGKFQIIGYPLLCLLWLLWPGWSVEKNCWIGGIWYFSNFMIIKLKGHLCWDAR